MSPPPCLLQALRLLLLLKTLTAILFFSAFFFVFEVSGVLIYLSMAFELKIEVETEKDGRINRRTKPLKRHIYT